MRYWSSEVDQVPAAGRDRRVANREIDSFFSDHIEAVRRSEADPCDLDFAEGCLDEEASNGRLEALVIAVDATREDGGKSKLITPMRTTPRALIASGRLEATGSSGASPSAASQGMGAAVVGGGEVVVGVEVVGGGGAVVAGGLGTAVVGGDAVVGTGAAVGAGVGAGAAVDGAVSSEPPLQADASRARPTARLRARLMGSMLPVRWSGRQSSRSSIKSDALEVPRRHRS